MALIGYARVSTQDQDPALQLDALKEAGCSRVFTDKASGTLDRRPQLDACLDHLREGDVLVVWRLDRLARSTKHLIDLMNDLGERKVEFRCLTHPIDTTSPGGRLIFGIFANLAEFERAVIVERTHAGLAAARARGRYGGRRPKLSPAKVAHARQLYDAKDRTVAEIAEIVGCSERTLYRALSSTVT